MILEPPKFTRTPGRNYRWVNEPTGHFVYVIETTQGMIKIGHAKDPKQRLNYLQVGNPYKLHLVEAFVLPDRQMAKTVEAHAHHRFDEFRFGGEWFKMPVKAATIGIALEIQNLGYCFTTQEEMLKHKRNALWELEKANQQIVEEREAEAAA